MFMLSNSNCVKLGIFWRFLNVPFFVDTNIAVHWVSNDSSPFSAAAISWHRWKKSCIILNFLAKNSSDKRLSASSLWTGNICEAHRQHTSCWLHISCMINIIIKSRLPSLPSGHYKTHHTTADTAQDNADFLQYVHSLLWSNDLKRSDTFHMQGQCQISIHWFDFICNMDVIV